MASRTLSVLAFLLIATSALAGCFQSTPTKAAAESGIARHQTIDVSRERMEDLGDMSGISPEEFLRRVIDASFEVRVGEAGDYTLQYTDVDGRERNETLRGMEPGKSRRVEDVDPLSGATLTRNGAVVLARAGVDGEWWRVGDVPLGLSIDAPGRTLYELTSRATSEATISDLRSSDNAPAGGEAPEFDIESATLKFDLPTKGTVSWDLVEDGREDRLVLALTSGLPKLSTPYVSFGLDGSFDTPDGKRTATAGVEVRDLVADVEGAVTLFVEDGEIVASRFDGADVAASVDVLAWVEADLTEEERAEMEETCPDGMSRARPCRIPDIPSFDESFDATERQPLDAEMFRATDADSREALRFLRTLLSQDLALGDSFTVRAHGDDSDVPGGAQGARFSGEFVYELVVAARERLTVPAGAFDALKLTQEVRFAANVDEAAGMVSGLDLNETVARSTLWLDAASYQPLRLEAESPVDVDRMIDEILGSISEKAWEGAPIERLTADDLSWTTTSTLTVVAKEVNGRVRMSPYVGLMTGSMLGYGANAGFTIVGAAGVYTWVSGFGSQPSVPARSVALVSAGPIDGSGESYAKSYTVASASAGLGWDDLLFTLDGETLACAMYTDEPGTFRATSSGMPAPCSEGVAYGPVQAGDVVTFWTADSPEGSVLRVIDQDANSVLLSLIIHG